MLLFAGAGAGALHLTRGHLPNPTVGLWRYGSAALGGLVAMVVVWKLLHEQPGPQRRGVALASGAIGFFVGAAAAATLAKYAWAAGYGVAWAPAFLLFLVGFGSERFAHELSRLENEVDDQAKRPAVITRAEEIRDAARDEARRLDRDGKSEPDGIGDPRAVYAYAAQVAAYGHALDRRFDRALASLGPVPHPWMPGPMRLLMLGNLAFWHLCLDQVAEAKKIVDGADDKSSVPESRPIFRCSKALVLVRDGKPDDALEIVGAAPGEGGEPKRLRPRYSLVRAHALFASGKEDAARAEVRSALDEPDGADELRRFLPAGGPAKALIEELLGDAPKKQKKAKAKEARPA
jgi:hypothetical protein